jgi:hypothetical protein
MTTTAAAKKELEALLLEMSEEEHKALNPLCIGNIPMPVSVFAQLKGALPEETKKKYEGRIRQLTKLNALLDLNRDKTSSTTTTTAPPEEEPLSEQKQQTTTTIELTEDLVKEITLDDVAKILATSIKKDDPAKLITFCGMVLAQTNEDQLNIGFQSESSAGKSYIPVELATYFPKDEVSIIGSASPTAFFHDRGTWDNERQVLIVNTESKMFIFLDQPHFQLLEKLRPLLSHDMKELQYKITDKNQKQGLRTKNVIVRGFPSVFFCTTKMDPDEQEKTRMILLSPSTDQEKLRASLELIALKKGNQTAYEKTIKSDPRRVWLSNRIKAIRQTGIREVIIPNNGKDVYDRFIKEHAYLMPRHQRDFPRIFSLIKAHALLNCFHREKILNGNGDQPLAIMATEADIEAGFELYKRIGQSNELGLSPYIYKVYDKIFKPLLSPHVGVSRKQIQARYYAVFHKMPQGRSLENEIIPQLEAAGLIEQRPDPEDRRSKLIYSTVSEDISAESTPNLSWLFGDSSQQ